MSKAEAASEVASLREDALYQAWTSALAKALQREKSYRTRADEVVKLFEAEKEGESEYNILYSNTETLAPALYNAPPRPQVRRRFKDNDTLGFVAARTAQRLLEYHVDDDTLDHPTFDDLMRDATLNALVPGRGVVRFRYHAEFAGKPGDKPAKSADKPDDTDPQAGPAAAVVRSEYICGELVPWDYFRHGYALTWAKVPWVSYEAHMTREELRKNFGSLGDLVELSEMSEGSDSEKQGSSGEKGKTGLKTAQVFEIWDKHKRRVLFISPGLPGRILKEVPDPLKLEGFFDCPEPLRFTRRLKGLVPIPLYSYYRGQARELNRITGRIQKIVAALRVRGMYDAQIEGIEKALEAADNELLPAGNLAALQGTGQAALEKAVWLFPLDKLVAVLQQLYAQRTQIKQVIFEITGIADIMRGSSQASETLGAQELKNRWGTLRLKRAQKEAARFATESLNIIAEMAVGQYKPETVAAMTGLNYPTLEAKTQAQAQIQQLRVAAQQAQILGQTGGAPQSIPPELQAVASAPAWEEILGLLRNDLLRKYRIDIETNSTVDVEATEDKEDINELLTAISQFFSGIAPLIQSGSLPFDMAKSMLLAVVRRFRFGEELEEQLQGMQAPQPQESPELKKEAERLKAEAEKLQQERQQLQLDIQQARNDLQLERKEFELEQRHAAREMQLEIAAAGKELERTAKLHETALTSAEAVVQERLGARQSAVEGEHARTAEQLETKKQEIAEGGSQLQETQQALAKALEEVQALLKQMAEKAAQRPTKAVRTADGVWEVR